jgi:tRNA threonylcarbamoyladenosine biosynthesis protein TsaE
MSDVFNHEDSTIASRAAQSDFFVFVLRDAIQTRRVARALGEVVDRGRVLALTGPLGAGKTTFVQGLAEGLEVSPNDYVRSPTFALIHEHAARIPLYHIDLYRIEDYDALENLGLDEYLEAKGVCAVEWFDKFRGDWPPETIEINIDYKKPGQAPDSGASATEPSNRRWLRVRSTAPAVEDLLERWVARAAALQRE